MARGIAELFHRGDAGNAQALLHASTDPSDVFELKAVELLRQVLEIDESQSVGLFEFAGELGEKAVGREADRGADVGANLCFQRGFDFKGFGASDFGWLPMGWQATKHLVD